LHEDRGEAAGAAETSTPDGGCTAPQVLKFKPVIWNGRQVQELPIPSEDLDGVAFAINQNG
jgi:hypothetical protein